MQREEGPIAAFLPIPVWPPGKQKQEQPLVEVLEELRAKLQWTQGELEAQREAERQRQVQVGVQGKETQGVVPSHAQDSCRAQIPIDFSEPKVRDRVPSSLVWGMIRFVWKGPVWPKVEQRVVVFCIAMLKASELEHNVLRLLAWSFW